MVMDEETKLDKTLCAKSMIVVGMGSTEVRKVFTPLDPGMDLSARQKDEEKVHSSSLLYARNLGTLVFPEGMTRPDIFSVRELTRRVASPCICDTGGDYKYCFAM